MSYMIFLKSMIIGIAIAAPVGPISILLIKTVLSFGLAAGIAVGFGAALADVVFASIAAFGFTAIAAFLMGNISIIKFIGGGFLIFLGAKEVFTKISIGGKEPKKQHLIHIIISTFFLTMTSPMAIIGFIAAFPSIGDICCSISQSMVAVFGIFVGSMIWSLSMSVIVNHMHHFLSEQALRMIKLISGLFLIAFGLYSMSISLQSFFV